MAKHKKHEEHVDESWLVPYADVLTLLLALFIVLFAMSSVDAEKFKQMAVSFNQEFSGGTGTDEFLSPEMPKTDMNLTETENKEMSEEQKLQALKEKLKQQEMNELKELKQRMDAYIEQNNLKLSLKTTLTEKGLMLTIMDNALFDSGKAYIKPESLTLAKEISKLLVSKPPREIHVVGHTDNEPINNHEFNSNWDLSTQRAVNFLEILLHNKELVPEKFSAVGHGEFMPVAPNTDSAGKARNRRVEVLILPLLKY